MQIHLKYCDVVRRIVLQFQSASAVKLYILRYYRGGMKNVRVILHQLGMVRTWYNYLDNQMGWKVEAVACNQWMNMTIKWNPLS